MKAPSLSSNASVSLKGQVAVVAGASQGIGLGVALRFARASADVWVLVRNEQKGKDVVEQLKQAGAPDARYFLADLSRKDEVLRAADEIKAAAGDGGVGYLIQTQGGPAGPNDTAPGMDPHFAVQVFSRVVLAHALRHTVKHSSVAVAVAGMGSNTFDTADITLDRLKATRGSSMLTIFAISARDATVLDSAWMELAKDSSPGLQYLHLFPGRVRTHGLANSGYSAPLVWASWLSGLVMSQTVEDYAEIPFFLAANPEGRELVAREGGRWNNKLSKLPIAPRAEDDATRKAIWDWLLEKMAV